MRVRLGSRSGHGVRQFAAREEPNAVEQIEDPLAEEEVEPTAVERWDRLISELDGEDEIEDPVPPPIAAAVSPPEPSPLVAAFGMMGKLVEALASRPEPQAAAAPVIHVHNHDPDLSVNVHPAAGPHVNVTLPDPEPPNVTVENHNHLPEPSVEVNVAAADVRPPDVHVQVAAPEVTVEAAQVTVEPPDVHVSVEQPRPGAVRLEIAEDGSRRFIPED